MSAQRSNSASGTKKSKRQEKRQQTMESGAFQISNLRERTQRDENDEVVTSRKCIANTFAKCYNKL